MQVSSVFLTPILFKSEIQKCLVEQKKQPPACALKELSVTDSDRMTNPRETGEPSVRTPESTQGMSQ